MPQLVRICQSYSRLVVKPFMAFLIVAVCIVSLVTFTSCGEDKQRFVGEWSCELQQLGADGLAYRVDHTLLINEDGTYNYEIVQWERRSNEVAGSMTLTGDWSVKGDVVTLIMQEEDAPLTISKDGKTLTDADGYKFTKQTSD